MLGVNMIVGLGTCRVKRPRVYFSSENKALYSFVKGHLHYPAEILQFLKHIEGETEICDESLHYVYDDLNNGALKTISELRSELNKNLSQIQSAKEFVIEVSSIKKLIVSHEKSNFYGNITAVSNISKGRSFLSDEITPSASVQAQAYKKDEFVHDLEHIAERLDKKITFISHFRCINPKNNSPILAREKLCSWLEDFCKASGFDYFDQSELVVENQIPNDVLKDTSHYTEYGEQLMGGKLEGLFT